MKTKSFGEHLRHLREEAGLTLKFVSDQISIDTSLLAKIERNERQPTKQIIKLVAYFFKVDEKGTWLTFLNRLKIYFILTSIKIKHENIEVFRRANNLYSQGAGWRIKSS